MADDNSLDFDLKFKPDQSNLTAGLKEVELQTQKSYEKVAKKAGEILSKDIPLEMGKKLNPKEIEKVLNKTLGEAVKGATATIVAGNWLENLFGKATAGVIRDFVGGAKQAVPTGGKGSKKATGLPPKLSPGARAANVVMGAGRAAWNAPHYGFGAIDQSLGQVSKMGAMGLAPVIDSVKDAAEKAIGPLKSMGENIESMVGAYSPVDMMMFDFVLRDIQGVLGERLAPVMELVTKGLRLIADVLDTILPSSTQFEGALKPLSEAFDMLRDVFADIAPLLQDIMVVALQAFAVALRVAIYPLQLLVELLRAIGIIGAPGDKKLRDSFGRGGQPAHFTTGEQMAQDLYSKAFSVGKGADPQLKMSDDISAIRGFVQGIANVLNVPKNIRGAIEAPFRDFTEETKKLHPMKEGETEQEWVKRLQGEEEQKRVQLQENILNPGRGKKDDESWSQWLERARRAVDGM